MSGGLMEETYCLMYFINILHFCWILFCGIFIYSGTRRWHLFRASDSQKSETSVDRFHQ